MPKHLSCGVTARLSVYEFDESRRSGEITFSERPIGEDGSQRNICQYIGENEDMPFFMVEVGEELNQDGDDEDVRPTTENSRSTLEGSPLTSLGATPTFGTPSQGDTGIPPPAVQDTSVAQDALAKALSEIYKPLPQSEKLALKLAVQTTTSTHVLFPGKKVLDTDLKVEVFFNGCLANVEFVNTRRVGAVLNTKETQGTRFHREAEKPWVYLRGEALPESKISAGERWSGIGRLLENEATQRGVDQWGVGPPTAEYLNALSNVSLPGRLSDMAHFGVVDVLISTGKGSKHEPSKGYLSEPSRMDSFKYQATGPMPAGEILPVKSNDTPFDSRASSVQINITGSLEDPFSDPPLPKHDAHAPAIEPSNPISAAEMLPSTSSDVPLAQRSRAPSVRAKNSFSSPKVALSSKAAPSPKATHAVDGLEALLNDIKASPTAAELRVKTYTTNRGKPGKARPVTARIGDIKQMGPEKRAQAIQTLREELDLPATKSATDNVNDFRAELALVPNLKSFVIEPFTNSRGKPSGAATVEERLGHIKKMTPKNSLRAIQELREAVGFVKADASNKTSVDTTPKKPVVDRPDAVVDTVENEDADMEDAPHELDPDSAMDQAWMLAQVRTDMVIDMGLSPNGHLADRIASLSPHRTPSKKSPAATPSRESPVPRNTASFAATPESSRRTNRSRINSVTASIRKDSTFTGQNLFHGQSPLKVSTPERFAGSPAQPTKTEQTDTPEKGPPKKKARQKASTPEETAEQALASFEIPEMCQGSAISYSEGKRQVAKIRPGSFEEEQVVVGMRFVVI